MFSTDLANAADEGPMSRRKSLKKSLRESFRRLRRGRSQRKTGRPGPTSPTSSRPQRYQLQFSVTLYVNDRIIQWKYIYCKAVNRQFYVTDNLYLEKKILACSQEQLEMSNL